MAVYILILFSIILVVSKLGTVNAVSAVVGSTLQLKCPHRATDGKRINWSKTAGDYPGAYSEGYTINSQLDFAVRSRLSVTGDRAAGEQHLSIFNVRKSDEGTYRCALSGTSSITSLQLVVITNIPTSVWIENVGLDNKLNGSSEGQNLMIRCSAVGGDPSPDVKLLISESVVKRAKQSVQYTLSSVNRSYDGQNVNCLAGYEDIPYYPLNHSARIYLKLKPYPPRFSSDSANTEEIKPLVISCTSTGSRPIASIYWLLGDSKTNITANATQLPSYHDPTTETYSVTSTLTYSFGRIYNGKYLVCGASNEVTTEQRGGVESLTTLNITYAPDITVTSPKYTQDDADRTVTCNPSGNPNNYTYHKWQHKSKYGEIIREFDGNKTLHLPDVPVILRYQDGGEYVCIASTGIKDKDNKLEQTGSGLVTVNAQPVFTSDTIDKVKQFGEIHNAVDIYVNVYSVPIYTSYVWTRDGKPMTQNSVKYQLSSSLTIVKDTFYGKEVQLDGYNVTLTIHDLEANDFSNYTITLKSAFPDVQFTIVLESPISTTSSAFIGPIVGVVVTLVVVCVTLIVILLFKRSQGKDIKEKNDKSHKNSGFLPDIQKRDEYEVVENKFDVEYTQSRKTYETLGTKENISVYDDLENAKGETSSKSQQEDKNHFKKPNDSSESMELNTTLEPTEKVYENEVL